MVIRSPFIAFSIERICIAIFLSISGIQPLPIPNREVKPRRADDTWWLTHGKVGRRQGFFYFTARRSYSSRLFFMHIYTVEASKTDLASVLDIASKGDEVVLTRNSKPLAR